MLAHDIKAKLESMIDQQALVTFSDGVTWSLVVGSVDEEGFTHSGPDGGDSNTYWTRFEDVIAVYSESESA